MNTQEIVNKICRKKKSQNIDMKQTEQKIYKKLEEKH